MLENLGSFAETSRSLEAIKGEISECRETLGGVEDAAVWSVAATHPRSSCHKGGLPAKNNFIPTRNGMVFAATN